MPKRQFYDYEGELVVIRYEPRRCIHAEECVKGLPGVFERDRRPWIDPNQATVQEVVDAVARCPTGALRVERRDGGPPEPSPERNTAHVLPDGPVYLEGQLELHLSDGTERSESRVALCRCGDSQNKPFCDNSHLDAGFTDDAVLGVARMAPAAQDRSDPLQLSTAPNGPVRFQGPLEIVGGDGIQAQRGDKGFLCRCGASENTPYCDGSHAAAGFEAE